MAIDIADFFTSRNEEEGIWFEPKVKKDGKELGIGIEFRLLGNSSDAAVLAGELYEKELSVAEGEKDSVKKSHLERDALVKRIAAMVVDIRPKGGEEILIDGKPLSYSRQNVEAILAGSRVIRSQLLSAFMATENFMTRKD